MKEELKLRPFQKEGLAFIEAHGGRCIVGDDMGLGKTVQALAYLRAHPDLRPAIVVCPASLKLNWGEETKKWTGEDAFILEGRKTPGWIPSCSIYIINYDILAEAEPLPPKTAAEPGRFHRKPARVLKPSGWYSLLIGKAPRVLIGDEAQFINNPDAIRTKAFRAIADSLGRRAPLLLLSGTPIEVGPDQFWVMLHLMGLFPTRTAYRHRYCDPQISYSGIKHWDYSGASNLKELHEKVQTVMIRRLKRDVLPELPPKQKIVVPMMLDPAEERYYRGVDREFIEWVRANQDASLVDADPHIALLRQLAYITKRNSVLQWTDDFLASGNKLVLFTYHRRATADVYNYFRKVAVKMDGSTPAAERQGLVHRFQEDPKCRLFVGQIKAAGVGHTLTAASAVAFAEFGQTAGQHEQAEDRINRIGQEADSITAYYLVAPGTVDDSTMRLIRHGYGVVSSILDGQVNADFFEGSLDSGILSLYRRKASR